MSSRLAAERPPAAVRNVPRQANPRGGGLADTGNRVRPGFVPIQGSCLTSYTRRRCLLLGDRLAAVSWKAAEPPQVWTAPPQEAGVRRIHEHPVPARMVATPTERIGLASGPSCRLRRPGACRRCAEPDSPELRRWDLPPTLCRTETTVTANGLVPGRRGPPSAVSFEWRACVRLRLC